jgi:hypothetical protein
MIKNILLVFLTVMTLQARNAEDSILNSLKYKKDLIGFKPDNQLSAFKLDKDIYENIDSFAEIRVMEYVTQVPFRVEKQYSKQKVLTEKHCKSEIISLKQNDDNSIEIIIKRDKDSQIPSKMIIKTDDKNFDKNVLVYTGKNIDDWDLPQKPQSIYDYSEIISLRQNTISLNKSKHLFYKVVISNFSEQQIAEKMELITEKQLGKDFSEIKKQTIYNKKLHIKSIELKEISHIWKEKQPITELVYSASNEWSQVDQTTEIVINSFMQPISEVELNPYTENFFRKIQIFKSADKESWRRIKDDEIYNYHLANISRQRLKINIPETRTKYIKLKIYNNDSQPISLNRINLYGPVYHAEFLTQNQISNLAVYYGGELPAPKYDINQILNSISNPEFTILKLGEQTLNPLYNQEKDSLSFLSKKSTLYIVIAIILATLAFVVASCIKKINNLPTE